jgi:hypothetical protein
MICTIRIKKVTQTLSVVECRQLLSVRVRMDVANSRLLRGAGELYIYGMYSSSFRLLKTCSETVKRLNLRGWTQG